MDAQSARRDPTPWTYAKVELGTYPAPEDEPANAFIQWKGTDVCFDFYCECGGQGHFDGYFAAQLRCGNCGAIWVMPFTVYPVKVPEALTSTSRPVDLDMDNHPERPLP